MSNRTVLDWPIDLDDRRILINFRTLFMVMQSCGTVSSIRYTQELTRRLSLHFEAEKTSQILGSVGSQVPLWNTSKGALRKTKSGR